MSVYTITVTLTPAEDAALRARALRDGRTAEELLRQAVRAPARRGARPYNPGGLIAALDSFLEGDEDEQRTTLAQLQKDIDHDRPGQRAVFGVGLNPPLPPNSDDPKSDETR